MTQEELKKFSDEMSEQIKRMTVKIDKAVKLLDIGDRVVDIFGEECVIVSFVGNEVTVEYADEFKSIRILDLSEIKEKNEQLHRQIRSLSR